MTNLDYLITTRAVFTVIGVGFALFSLFWPPKSESKKKVILALWGLVPPIFFWFEHYYVTNVASYSKDYVEKLQHFQTLSASIWGAVFALLGITYFKHK